MAGVVHADFMSASGTLSGSTKWSFDESALSLALNIPHMSVHHTATGFPSRVPIEGIVSHLRAYCNPIRKLAAENGNHRRFNGTLAAARSYALLLPGPDSSNRTIST